MLTLKVYTTNSASVYEIASATVIRPNADIWEETLASIAYSISDDARSKLSSYADNCAPYCLVIAEAVVGKEITHQIYPLFHQDTAYISNESGKTVETIRPESTH